MKNSISVNVAILMGIGCTVFFGVNPSFAGTLDLPQTGQTTCYDSAGNVIACSGTGQDGDIQAGVSWPDPRFTDNGDGTITDSLTGLMWLKDAGCLGKRTWPDALDTVNDFNTHPSPYTCGGYTATHSDWTLPNINELESLINAEEPDLTAWLNGQGFLNVQPGYWSSTTLASYANGAWFVMIAQPGDVYYSGKAFDGCVWPVRVANPTPPAAVWKTGQNQSYAASDDGALQRGAPWPGPRFTDNGNGTVTDHLTGLMWLKDANCFASGSWQKALDEVADLNANPGSYSCGGYTGTYYSDWRLPNTKELHSLTDFSRHDPALPEGHPFSNVAQGTLYWSSTTTAYETSKAWGVAMDEGTIVSPFFGSKSDVASVWPVRAGVTEALVSLDIKANGSDGPITVSSSDPVAIEVSLDPGNRDGQLADWWIAVNIPFAPTGDWYSYVYSHGWCTGVHLCAKAGLFDLAPFEVLNMMLPVGTYTFYFAIDNPDGLATGPWWGLDSVVVNVN